MLEILALALLQAVAGDPAPPADTQTPAVTEQVGEIATPPDEAAEQSTQPPRQCRRIRATGTRLGGSWSCGRTRAEEDRSRYEREHLDHANSRVAGCATNPGGCFGQGN